MNKNSAYYRNMVQRVIDNSEASHWESAVHEWEIVDWKEDETLETSCICGKEHLKYIFTIRNTKNGNILHPIGSSCIKKFERDDLNEEATVKEQLFRLLHAIEENKYITLSPDFFSRKLRKRQTKGRLPKQSAAVYNQLNWTIGCRINGWETFK